MALMHSRLIWSCLLATIAFPAWAEPPKFEFQPSDRVVFLGGTFCEREGDYGYIETAVASSVPNVQVTFRNLGWNGDTVWADARNLVDSPHGGYPRMIDLVKELKPTVLFLAYGATESFKGDAGLAPFVQQYEKLLDDLAPLECRLLFFTPHQFETPLPEASVRNAMLEKYAREIRGLAERRKGWVIDLFDRTASTTLATVGTSPVGPDAPRGFQQVDGVWKSLPLTEDGVRLSPYGYVRAARSVLQELKLPRHEFLLHLDAEGDPESDVQTHSSEFHGDGKQVDFKMRLLRLPEPPTPIYPRDVEYFMIAGGGLPSGFYELKIDGKVAALNPTMLVGFPIRAGADYEQAETLRKKIVAKNRYFFDRWRAQPFAPLAILRQEPERPSPARIARPDPLLEQAETEIGVLKKPVTRHYEIVPRAEEAK